MMVAMGTAQRLFKHVIDNSQSGEIAAGESQGRGGLGGMFVALPQDAGAALGADHAVVGVLQHGDAIADADAERTAGAAFTNHDAYDGNAESAHFEHALGDHLRLASLFGSDPRIGTRRIDEADQRQPVLFRQPHLAHRLAVALGVGAAEVAGGSFLVGTTFLVTDHQDLEAIQFGEAGEHRTVVAEVLVPVQLDKLVERQIQVVAGVGSILVPGDLHGLPCIERTVGLAQLLDQAPGEARGSRLRSPRFVQSGVPDRRYDSRVRQCHSRIQVQGPRSCVLAILNSTLL